MTSKITLEQSLSTSFHDCYKEYGLKRRPNLSVQRIAKMYFGWLTKWAPDLAIRIQKRAKGDRAAFAKIVADLLGDLSITEESDSSDNKEDGKESDESDSVNGEESREEKKSDQNVPKKKRKIN